MRSILALVCLFGWVGFVASCKISPATPTQTIIVTLTVDLKASLTPSPIITPTPMPLISQTSAATETLLPLDTLTPTSSPISLQICSPLRGYTFTELPGFESQSFTPNRPGKDDGHQGVDFAHWRYKDRASLEGVPIQSVLPGVVSAAVPDKYPYGNMIIIETSYAQLASTLVTQFQLQPEQSLYLLYAHMKEPSPFKIGNRIDCGELIGSVGNTGASGNPHLHLETRTGQSGVRFQSMEYYQTTSTPEERANYERWRFLGDFILFDPWILLGFGR
jgi:murein DD-endopeptidase MepM/ murein hydrolase activator NlpD